MSTNPVLPPSVNFHMLQACNMHCRHCFATFPDVDGRLDRTSAIALVQRLAVAGFQKITFAGGEPTLCPWLPDLVRAAKRAGMTTMLVTNGSKLDKGHWIFAHDRPLDWIALSIDSGSADTHRALGRSERGRALAPDDYLRFAARIRGAGIRLKVNTVVTTLNHAEDMRTFVRALAPERWKVLRVLPVGGQNDGKVEPLLVTHAQFAAFVDRHRELERDDITVVGEDHDDIVGGYAMVDPLGRFFDDTRGHHTYSDPILDVGVEKAFGQITFHRPRFERRGGVYQWQGTPARRRARIVAFVGTSGSGKDTAAEQLVRAGYQRVAVADRIKGHVAAIFDLRPEQLHGPGRDVRDERLHCTPREAYQVFSDACCAIDPDVWRRPWRQDIEHRLAEGVRVVCTDVRTEAELDVIRTLGGLVIRIRRAGAGATGHAALHPHETALAQLDDATFDAVIDNDGDLQDLYARVDAILSSH